MIEKKTTDFGTLWLRHSLYADTTAFRIKFHVISRFNAQFLCILHGTAPQSDTVLSCVAHYLVQAGMDRVRICPPEQSRYG